MKKVLIVLLSVLLLVSFVSCEKDKSEEIIETYEDYWRTNRIIDDTIDVLSSDDATKNKTTLDKNDFNEYRVSWALRTLGYEEEIKSASDCKVISGEGSTSFTSPDENSTLQTYKDIKVSAKTVDSEGNTVDTYTLVFNGTEKVTREGSGDSATDTHDVNFTITVNDDTHTYTMKYVNVKDQKNNFVSASVNGKTIDVRLLNSMASIDK